MTSLLVPTSQGLEAIGDRLLNGSVRRKHDFMTGHGLYVKSFPIGTDISQIVIPGSATASQASSKEKSDISIADAPNFSSPAKIQMSKPVLFYGKPGQLESVLTYCTVKFLAEQTPDESKAAVLASHFRGPALQWLTTTLAKRPNALQHWDLFETEVKNTFGLDDTAQKSQAARKLANCRQKTSVQEYAILFKALAKEAEIPDATATALFIKGLKPQIRSATIIRDDNATLADALAEAQRIDNQLFYARSTGSGQQGNTGHRRRGGGKKNATSVKHEY